jgi:hypothetical protein
LRIVSWIPKLDVASSTLVRRLQAAVGSKCRRLFSFSESDICTPAWLFGCCEAPPLTDRFSSFLGEVVAIGN